MRKTDVFAHVLPEQFYKAMLAIEPKIPEQYPFFNNPVLTDQRLRRSHWDGVTRQVISFVNANPEDYTGPEESAALCRAANQELSEIVCADPDLFESGVAMVPMNHIPAAVKIIQDQVAGGDSLVGVQIFTRAIGKSIADPAFRELFDALNAYQIPAWLHPVFDARKPDNNIVFSWEYELTQAMFQMVQAGLLRDFPNLKIICHHAGAMAPFFAGRIDRILPGEQAEDFRKFYVDTAILGNPKALDLAADFYGVDHLLFGTDAPLGILPAGATKEIAEAIEQMSVSETEKAAIFDGNYRNLVKERGK